MKYFQTKAEKLAGTNYKEVYQKAFRHYLEIKRRSKRRTYIRSAYFNKGKVFLSLFWQHLHDKFSLKDKIRRVKYFPCAIELIKKSHFGPASKENVDKKSEILHRFAGVTKDGTVYFVQIKEYKRSGEKFLISIFPLSK